MLTTGLKKHHIRDADNENIADNTMKSITGCLSRYKNIDPVDADVLLFSLSPF